MKTSLEIKTSLRSFKLYRRYLDPPHLSNVCNFFLEFNP